MVRTGIDAAIVAAASSWEPGVLLLAGVVGEKQYGDSLRYARQRLPTFFETVPRRIVNRFMKDMDKPILTRGLFDFFQVFMVFLDCLAILLRLLFRHCGGDLPLSHLCAAIYMPCSCYEAN